MIKIGINGFGRIGRLAFRNIIKKENLQIVGINDLANIDDLAYLLKYDSVHGRFNGNIEIKNDKLIVNNQEIRITSEKNPENIKWDEIDVDFVIESTGLFTDKAKATLHLKAGAKKVIISAPSKDANMYVMGVNHTNLQTTETVFSNASCTTNCLAPILKTINDTFGFKEGFMTTVHATTTSQNTVDTQNNKRRRGRAAMNNIIPTTTSATTATLKILPELKGKFTGMAVRVPVANVSLVDISFKTEKETSLNEILSALKKASETNLKGILGYTEDAVVSQDFVSEPRTSVIDASASQELSSNFFKIIAWYDNEFGYATKIVDLLEYATKL